jgi:hypothetical protein
MVMRPETKPPQLYLADNLTPARLINVGQFKSIAVEFVKAGSKTILTKMNICGARRSAMLIHSIKPYMRGCKD